MVSEITSVHDCSVRVIPNSSEVGMLCASVAGNGFSKLPHTIRMVMTIREKFADLRFLVSKYKDTSMVLFLVKVGDE